MAIQKSKTLANGVEGDYWKITEIKIDKINIKVTYTISLFLNSDHRLGIPVWRNAKKYTFQMTREQLDTNLTEIGYPLIIARAEEMVPPLFGQAGDDLVEFDPDLAGGTEV